MNIEVSAVLFRWLAGFKILVNQQYIPETNILKVGINICST